MYVLLLHFADRRSKLTSFRAHESKGIYTASDAAKAGGRSGGNLLAEQQKLAENYIGGERERHSPDFCRSDKLAALLQPVKIRGRRKCCARM